MFWQLDFPSVSLDAHWTAHFQVVTPARALLRVVFCNLGLRCRYCHFFIRRRRKATLRCAEFNPQLHVVRSLNFCARSRIWGCLHHAAELWRLGVASVSDLWTQCDGDEVWASRTDFNRSTKRPCLEHHGFVARSRRDHPVLDCTTGISQSLALPAVVSEEGRARVLWCADARTVTRYSRQP